MDIKPGIAACHNFYSSNYSEAQKVTIIIVPIRIIEGDKETMISWTCNNGAKCYNDFCVYAHGGKDEQTNRSR